MEGIGGIGTAEMTRSNGKDYHLGRQLMTAEVNAVVSAIIKFNNEAEITRSFPFTATAGGVWYKFFCWPEAIWESIEIPTTNAEMLIFLK